MKRSAAKVEASLRCAAPVKELDGNLLLCDGFFSQNHEARCAYADICNFVVFLVFPERIRGTFGCQNSRGRALTICKKAARSKPRLRWCFVNLQGLPSLRCL